MGNRMYFDGLLKAPSEAEAQCAELARAGKVGSAFINV